MARAFKLPDLGEGLTEGEVARWLVSEGQEIAEDDPLVEIQTDKATVDIPSPYAGTVLRILVAEGEIAPVGAELVLIGEPGESLSEAASTLPSDDQLQGATYAGTTPDGTEATARSDARNDQLQGSRAPRVQATPLVRRVAQELGVDLASVPGTGSGGKITEDDVRAAAGAASQEGRREPLRGVRRIIAEHMARAHREVPSVTWVEECDFSDVHMPHLIALVMKACAESLVEYPELNARLEGDEIVYLERYDFGLAVQTDLGLVVPVVRGVDTKPVEEVHAEVARMADAARQGTLRAEELRGSTFTVTSAGKQAGLFQTPIVNHPEVAILSVGRIEPRPVVRDGEIVVRKMGTISLSFDHRVIDGARATGFGLAVIARIEGRP
jgi:pyruvate/2-oxoglutarate dehydrogenase complex dihydrolipoamide acyltransferase (E2) component